MNGYEFMFLLDPKLDSAASLAVVERVEGIVKGQGGQIVSLKAWERRRLAYPVDGRNEGLYMLCYFDAPPEAISGIESRVRLAEGVLRFIVLRTDRETRELDQAADVRRREEKAERAAAKAQREQEAAEAAAAAEAEAAAAGKSAEEKPDEKSAEKSDEKSAAAGEPAARKPAARKSSARRARRDDDADGGAETAAADRGKAAEPAADESPASEPAATDGKTPEKETS